MPTRFSLIAIAILLLALLAPAPALARQPKTYQVTGTVLEVTSDFIAVDKSGERWEIGRTADTKVTGQLKVGQKVTVEYRMSASRIEAKSDKGGDGKSK